jgi:hypothetical protein
MTAQLKLTRATANNKEVNEGLFGKAPTAAPRLNDIIQKIV